MCLAPRLRKVAGPFRARRLVYAPRRRLLKGYAARYTGDAAKSLGDADLKHSFGANAAKNMTANHFLHELRATFVSHSKRPAITHRQRLITFAELDALCACSAAWLRSLGVSPGDRV